MNKIKELINTIDFVEGFRYADIEHIMKEYAEYYAKECLEIAAGNVKFQYGYMDVEGTSHKEIVDIDYEHTFNFDLPKHEEL